MRRIFISAILLVAAFCAFAQRGPDALALYRAGNYAESIRICEDEIKSRPSNLDSYVVMCWSLIANREYARAEQMAYEGQKISRYDIRLIEILGEAKYYLGKNSEALKQFQEYIANTPDKTGARIDTAYYFMGEIYIRQTKFQHADIALSAATRKRTGADGWWTRLGYAREMAGNYYEAMAAYEKALELDPQRTDAINGKKRVSDRLR